MLWSGVMYTASTVRERVPGVPERERGERGCRERAPGEGEGEGEGEGAHIDRWLVCNRSTANFN